MNARVNKRWVFALVAVLSVSPAGAQPSPQPGSSIPETVQRPAELGVSPEKLETRLAEVGSELGSAVERVQWLVGLAIALGLANLALSAMRLSACREPALPTKGVDNRPASPSPVPADTSPRPVPVAEVKPDTRGAIAPATEASSADEFAQLPHGRIGRVLSHLLQAVPTLAFKLTEVRLAERFLRDLGPPLAARIGRFKEAALRGESHLRQTWLEQDLVTTLNSLSELLSVTIEERFRGGRVGRSVEEELQRWLYEKLAPACRDEGFFAIEEILPFTTRFDARIHRVVESKDIGGAENLIVGIKSIGRRDPRSKVLTHKAEVVIGK